MISQPSALVFPPSRAGRALAEGHPKGSHAVRGEALRGSAGGGGCSAVSAVGVRGLVSVPTTGKRAPQPPKTAQAVAELRHGIRAFVATDKGAARIARMRRSVGFSARSHLAELPGFRGEQVLMVTATYRDEVDWRAEHVKEWLQHVRKWCKRQGVDCRYVWVAELTKRGRLHYHVALWLPRGHLLPKSDVQGWWPHGSTRTEVARKAVPYLLKYISKGTDAGRFPKGCRMHGAGGLEHAHRRAKRWLGLPGFVRARSDVFDDWRRARIGGGWLDPDGVCVPSEYQRAYVGGWGCIRVADYGRPFVADGPFTWLHRGAAA